MTDHNDSIDTPRKKIPQRVITLEEHFTTPAFLRATSRFTPEPARSTVLEAKLLDLGAGRIAAMDEGKIDLQILSLAATGQESLTADEATSLVREANEIAFTATQVYPERLACFASLALKNPGSAAGGDELEAASLQRGHGLSTVESFPRRSAPNSKGTSFNEATVFRPWRGHGRGLCRRP